MANPTRMPRIVGSSGLQLPNLPFIPPGTSVSPCVWCLHVNPSVFPNPHAFEPERWEKASEEMVRDSIPFGLGPRQCIARNLATAELYWAVEALVRRDLLKGAGTVREGIEILEWFNSRVKPEGKIEMVWKL
jgi:Cytochrome P450